MEIWKDVVGYEDIYQISNIGNLRNKKRNKLKKLTTSDYGYMRSSLWRNQKRFNCSVHRLVAEAFIPNPDNKPQVNHINGIKDDNRVENLEWCTQSENGLHAHRTGLVNHARGHKHSSSKLTKDDVLELRRLYKLNIYTLRQLGDMFNIADSTAYRIANKKTYKNI